MEKPIVFKNKKGRQLIGMLHLPDNRGRFPLVVICHGWGDNKTQRKFVRLARTLEKNRIAALRFDFEGCGDSEGDFLKATVKKEIADLKSAIYYVKKIKNIDIEKIAFVGHSMGAVICALFLAQNKVAAKIIAMWAPAFNQKELMKYWATSKEIKQWERQGYLYREGKEKIIGLDYLRENRDKDYSSIFKKVQLPVLIIHGSKDETVPVKFSKALAKIHKNIKLSVLVGADHKFEDYYIQQRLIKDTVRWIKSKI